MKFSIDGQEFNVIVTELARKGRVSESKLSGDVKSGAHFRDIIGTYYDYEMTVGSNALSETEYDALFEILTAPVESHEVVLPYGSNSIELSPSSASRLELVANASGGFSGGSIGGTVELIGLSAPTASNSAANKQYVDEHAGARVATGSYVGTGDYNSGTGWGSSNPTSLTFDFAPKLLIIGWQETLDSGFFTSNLGDTSNNYYSIYTGALTTQFKQYRGFGDPDSSYAKKSSDGKTITWYSTHHANSQRNDKRHKYYYLAIG